MKIYLLNISVLYKIYIQNIKKKFICKIKVILYIRY